MPWTTISKPAVGDPTRKTAFADAVIDNFAYLKSVSDTVLSSTAILNGSFESDTDADGVPDSWTFTPYTGGTKTHDSTDQRHGQYSFKMTSPGGASNGGGILQSSEFFEVSPLGLFSLSWFLKSSDAGVKNEVVALWYKSDQTASATPSTTLYSEATANPTSWAQFTSSAVPPADARYAKLQLIGCKNDDVTAGSTWFDGVEAIRIPAVVVLQDQKAGATNGGASTATTWHVRDLTAEVVDTAGICTLAANRFTLPPGVYEIHAHAPSYQGGPNKLALYNYTTSAYVHYGQNNPGLTTTGAVADLSTYFAITVSTTFELHHYITSAKATDGLGIAMNVGTGEVYSEVLLRRL